MKRRNTTSVAIKHGQANTLKSIENPLQSRFIIPSLNSGNYKLSASLKIIYLVNGVLNYNIYMYFLRTSSLREPTVQNFYKVLIIFFIHSLKRALSGPRIVGKFVFFEKNFIFFFFCKKNPENSQKSVEMNVLDIYSELNGICCWHKSMTLELPLNDKQREHSSN